MWRSQTRVKAEKHKKYKGIQQQRDLNKEPKKNGKQGSNKKNVSYVSFMLSSVQMV